MAQRAVNAWAAAREELAPMQMEGYCQCGCGEKTQPASCTSASKGLVKGRPVRFLTGHHRRKRVPHITDCGYETKCWLWEGMLTPAGYARMWNGRPTLAHRFFYEQANGPIPDGLTLDHLCEIKHCLNPDHLEPVTLSENSRRRHARERSRRTTTAAEAAAIPGSTAASGKAD